MKKALLFVCAAVLTSDIADASILGANDPGAINSQTVKELQLHESLTRSRNRNDAIIKTKTTVEKKPEVVDATIQNITFINNNIIPSTRLFPLVKDKLNQPMTRENISDVRRTIAKFYQNQGFFSVIVVVSSEDYKTGTIVLEIREGARNSVSVE